MADVTSDDDCSIIMRHDVVNLHTGGPLERLPLTAENADLGNGYEYPASGIHNTSQVQALFEPMMVCELKPAQVYNTRFRSVSLASNRLQWWLH